MILSNASEYDNDTYCIYFDGFSIMIFLPYSRVICKTYQYDFVAPCIVNKHSIQYNTQLWPFALYVIVHEYNHTSIHRQTEFMFTIDFDIDEELYS